MAKEFNVTAVCMPEVHYMVNLESRLIQIKKLVDSGKYFTINRARQYGKTTTLLALEQYLRQKYYVVLIDFQTFSEGQFKNENVFACSFARSFLRLLRRNELTASDKMRAVIERMEETLHEDKGNFMLQALFEGLNDICDESDKSIVLMIDEIDSAADNRIFIDFLAQFRACYIRRATQDTFQSVILSGVYDVKNLKRKIGKEEQQKQNSPWNIAADFTVDMSFSRFDIAGMLREYESDHKTGMDIEEVSGLIYDYTCGYPFLVSKLCKLMDEEIYKEEKFGTKHLVWTKEGVSEAVRLVLLEKNTLFESLLGKLTSYSELNVMLRTLLFTGKNIVFNPDEPAMDTAAMFGFIKNQGGAAVIANRIFETRLYNYYLSSAEMQGQDIYKASLLDKNIFIVDGYLDMRMILERFVIHFNELYGDSDNTFIEDEGRKYFLLYLRPIINGTGNYYIESQTRGLRRTDVIIDYHGEQYVIEMKIWHGDEYNRRGEAQLAGYLDDYHLTKGYMVSFNFNKNKQTGVHEIAVGDKTLIEAVV